MKRAVIIAVVLAGLAASLTGTKAKAETNSLMAVSMRTFPSDHFGRRVVPHCPPQGRAAYSARKSAVAKVSKPEVQKVTALAPPASAPAKPTAGAQAVTPASPPVGPAAIAQPKPGKPDVTAQLPVEVDAAPVKKVVLSEAPTRSAPAVPAAAPSAKPAPVPPAPAAPATCKQFVPSVGMMVDVTCEK